MLWQAARKHMDFPKYTMPGDVVAAFRDRGLVILLGIFGTARIVGFYSLAVRLVWAPQGLVSSSLTSVLFQRAAEEDDLSNLNLLVSGILSKMVWLATPVFVFLAWWSRDLFALFLGEQWRGAGVYAAILCAPALGLLLQGWMDRLLAVARALRVKFAIEAAYTTVGMTLLGASLYLSHNVPLSMGIFAAVTMLYHIAFLIAYYRVCQFPCVKLLHVGWQIVYVVFVTAVVFGSITLLLGNSLGMWLGLAALAVYYTIIACVRRKTTRPGGIREVSQPSIPFLL
jgi:O-antigen/teichoic acid export membrane protein